MKIFNTRVNDRLFNIYKQDANRHKYFNENCSIEMTDAEFQFLEDQNGARKGRLQNFMDKKLSRIANKSLAVNNTPIMNNVSTDIKDSSSHNNLNVCKVSSNDKINRYDETNTTNLNDIGQMISDIQDMPEKWANIRLMDGTIRPEFHSAIDELINIYECNKFQAVSAVITVGNIMFGRKWKHHHGNMEVDSKTAPEVRPVQQNGVEKSVEFVALKCILEEIMSVGEATIIFHYNNSKYLSIQGIKIGDNIRSFPKIMLLKESRENLRDMKMAVLNVLAVYCGVSPDELSNKISFTVHDENVNDKNDVETQAALEVSRYTIDEKRTDNITTRFDDQQFDMIIDVRTPDEYKEDHIPRAINLPVLNNEERCKVGTIYSGNSENLGTSLN